MGSAIHPEDFDRVMANWRASLAAGTPAEHELRCRSADGTYHWFLHRALPLRVDDGNVVKWYGTLTNIDTLKETESALQTREHQLVSIIETIPSLLWSASPDGEITHIRGRIREYSGLSLEDFLDLGWKKFLHPDDFEDTAKAFFYSIRTGESFNSVHRTRRADGESILRDLPAYTSFAIIVDPAVPNAIEKERRRVHDELHKKASQLATSIEFTRKALNRRWTGGTGDTSFP